MRVVILAAALSLIAGMANAEGSEEFRTCGEYLAMNDISRANFTASVIYLTLQRDKPGLELGASLITLNPTIRDLLDERCRTDGYGHKAPAIDALSVVLMESIAALTALQED